METDCGIDTEIFIFVPRIFAVLTICLIFNINFQYLPKRQKPNIAVMVVQTNFN